MHGETVVEHSQQKQQQQRGHSHRCRSAATRCSRICAVLSIQATFWTVLIFGAILNSEMVVQDSSASSDESAAASVTLGEFLWEHRAALLASPSNWWRQPDVQDAWRGFAQSRQRRFRRATAKPWEWGSEDGSAALYKTLRLPQTASMTEVKSAHRRLALELHPDRLSPSASAGERAAAAAAFQEMQDAYEELVEREAAASAAAGKRREGGRR